MKEYTKEELLKIINIYGITELEEFKMIDSSHGDDDIRHNYIIDNKYVLRVNSAPVMSEEKLNELNLLIKTYNEFGIIAPYFICGTDDCFLRKEDDNYIYFSEYLDMTIADDLAKENENLKEDLKLQRLIMVARFAQQHKNQNLTSYYSMYSLFDLADYDIPYGADEKQQNVDELVKDLRSIEENELADKLINENNRIRTILIDIYKKLPCCVFQGDENFSNVCINENKQIAGLFDFNMAGTDVNANYLANVAFLGRFVLDDDVFDTHDANWVLNEIVTRFHKSTDIIKKYYDFTQQELEAYYLYAKIVIFSGWANASSFQEFLKKPEYKIQCLQLIDMILDVDLSMCKK